MLADLLELKTNVEKTVLSAQKVAVGGFGILDGFISGLIPGNDEPETASPETTKSDCGFAAPENGNSPDESEVDTFAFRTPQYGDLLYRQDRVNERNLPDFQYTMKHDGILDGGKIVVVRVSDSVDRLVSAHMYRHMDSRLPLVAPEQKSKSGNAND